MIRALLLSLAILSTGAAVRANPPEIVAATAERSGMGWRIEVTLKHADTGWDHFADGWEVLDEAGNRIAYRKLHHPHVNEQPFTRSLPSVMIPDGTRRIFIRAHCSVNKGMSAPFELDLSY
ncbi:hypothetical protein GLS40_03060 [Pseudooceanicola sp. 216_PA32_1]|jgi:hypothetical protein|uniref:Uncharacterized protein n=1 Tax=Pseudooceanicola pacificus TaxID=2676438 RepID=A0A844WAZ9_9RHOB|nr:hypothetical protein [Pseudooceanicola pacificus]MWB77002.1 hypothetical protein [Pseudooceanicola pacificus]